MVPVVSVASTQGRGPCRAGSNPVEHPVGSLVSMVNTSGSRPENQGSNPWRPVLLIREVV